MKWLDGYRMRLMFASFIMAIMPGGIELANGDFVFGEPTNLGPRVNTSHDDGSPFISADGLCLYFGSVRDGGEGGWDLWMTTRETIDGEWGPCTNLGPTVNSSSGESSPFISADGLSLYFDSNREGGEGGWDLWMTTREMISDPWREPVNLGPTVNSPTGEGTPSISADGLELYFCEWGEFRPEGYGSGDLWVTKRPTKDDPWGTPVNLGDTVNSSHFEGRPFISADGLTLFFIYAFYKPGAGDIWLTRRATDSDLWCTPVNLRSTVNSPASAFWLNFSADGSTLYFSSERSGGSGGLDLWQASVTTIVDFNRDGIVDAGDICIMVDNWGTDEPLCDIGPMPWGDGIVDVEDLIVLAEHLFEEFPTVIPYSLDNGWTYEEGSAETLSLKRNRTGGIDASINLPTGIDDGGLVASRHDLPDYSLHNHGSIQLEYRSFSSETTGNSEGPDLCLEIQFSDADGVFYEMAVAVSQVSEGFYFETWFGSEPDRSYYETPVPDGLSLAEGALGLYSDGSFVHPYFMDAAGSLFYPFDAWDVSGITGTQEYIVDNDFEGNTAAGGTIIASVNLKQVVYGFGSPPISPPEDPI